MYGILFSPTHAEGAVRARLVVSMATYGSCKPSNSRVKRDETELNMISAADLLGVHVRAE